jgi:aspartyl-tRNA(Asn)/glutamyl-tRNA(Gln) amidotransferase subunit A
MNDVQASARFAAAGAELTYLDVAEAGRLIATKKLSPVELIDAHLERIAALNDRTFAYITVAADQARLNARAAEADIMSGRYRGPLHGIPYGLKDNYYTKGIRTTAASRLMWDFVPDVDATLHVRLQTAGAILLGKHNTWEYGTGTGEGQFDLPFPVARNPWDTAYFTAGSSSGTGAAVAAGTAMVGLGSDTGGSVRAPASANALFGLKPTYGRLSRAGILPNSFSLDAAGPLTRTVTDNALVMQAIAGADPRDPTTVDRPVPSYTADLGRGVKGLRIGFIRRFHERDVAAHPDVVAALEGAADILRGLGAEIVDVDVPHSVQDYRLVVRLIGGAESLAIHEKDFRERSGEMGVSLREKFLAMLPVSALDYVKATRWRRDMTLATDAALADCDALICGGPLSCVPKLADKQGLVSYMMDSATCCFNVSGHPAASICTGFDANGLPMSMQIVGRYWDEPMVLRVAAAYEQATVWHRRRPRCT